MKGYQQQQGCASQPSTELPQWRTTIRGGVVHDTSLQEGSRANVLLLRTPCQPTSQRHKQLAELPRLWVAHTAGNPRYSADPPTTPFRLEKRLTLFPYDSNALAKWGTFVESLNRSRQPSTF